MILESLQIEIDNKNKISMLNLTQDPHENDMRKNEIKNHFFLKDADIKNIENDDNINIKYINNINDNSSSNNDNNNDINNNSEDNNNSNSNNNNKNNSNNYIDNNNDYINNNNNENENERDDGVKFSDCEENIEFLTIHDLSRCQTPSNLQHQRGNQLQLQLQHVNQYQFGQSILSQHEIQCNEKVEEQNNDISLKLMRLERLEEDKKALLEQLEECSSEQESKECSPGRLPISSSTSFFSFSPSTSKVEERSLLLEEDLKNVLMVFDPLGKGAAGKTIYSNKINLQ